MGNEESKGMFSENENTDLLDDLLHEYAVADRMIKPIE